MKAGFISTGYHVVKPYLGGTVTQLLRGKISFSRVPGAQRVVDQFDEALE